MPAPTEFELELTCDDPSAITGHPLLANVEPSSVDELRSTYFDTPDHRLRAAGFALRVRSPGKGVFVQTLKGRGDGLIERPEWEAILKSAKPSLKAIADTPAAKVLGAKSKLAAQFEITVARTTYLLPIGGSEIEVALDRGRINAGGDVYPVGEIELKLKSGSPKELFVVATAFNQTVPLRLGVQSKAERGFELLNGKPSEAAKPDLIAMDDETTAAEAFRAIAHGCLRHMRLNENMLLDHRNPEVLHQARVAIRRLRSAMSLFEALVTDNKSSLIHDDLKRLSEPLGVARNLDVFLSETLPRERKKRPDETGLLNLETQLEVRRTEAYKRVNEMLRSAEWRALVLDLVTWINDGDWLRPEGKKAVMRLDQPARSFAIAALEKRRRQVKKRGRQLVSRTDEERHDLRISAKKLRYGSEFFAQIFDGKKEAKRHASFVSTLKDLQDHLGALNDISTGRQLVSNLTGKSAVFAGGLAAGDLDAGAEPLLEDAKSARKDLLKMRPFWR